MASFFVPRYFRGPACRTRPRGPSEYPQHWSPTGIEGADKARSSAMPRAALPMVLHSLGGPRSPMPLSLYAQGSGFESDFKLPNTEPGPSKRSAVDLNGTNLHGRPDGVVPGAFPPRFIGMS